jgi:hypothetical protein
MSTADSPLLALAIELRAECLCRWLEHERTAIKKVLLLSDRE